MAMRKGLLTSAELHRLLEYLPHIGRLRWRERTPDMFVVGQRSAEDVCRAWNARWAGGYALSTLDTYGYHVGLIYRRHYKAHRVIWCMAHGEWPEGIVDHKNGYRANNRLENLRVTTVAENHRNQKLRANNTSGHMGVSWDKRDRKWQAQIMRDGRRMHLGYFARIEDAVAARKAAQERHGFHENHGRRQEIRYGNDNNNR